MNETTAVDVLVVGAGPTGMTLAASLNSYGVRTRIVDRLTDRAHESRAPVVHARSLEIAQNLGFSDELMRRGNTSARIAVHLSPTQNFAILFDDIGASNTEFPFILFVSQAETEAVLNDHLVSLGQKVERGVEAVALTPDYSGVSCTLRDRAGHEEIIRASYVVGCDGGHSFVRHAMGVAFEGDTYPQTYVLGDVEVDGAITPDALNLYFGRHGLAVFFPLGKPRTWRMIGVSPRSVGAAVNPADSPELTLEQLQRIADVSVTTPLRLRDPDWLANFRLHHRQAGHYRSGRLFVAGDAAHVHSPLGGQGMNTGIQDAWNLGWKLALVLRGVATDALLDSYEAERWPVGRFLLRFTDRLFSGVTRLPETGPLLARVRTLVIGWILPRLFKSKKRRSRAFRTVSQLGIRYRESSMVTEGLPARGDGPKAGDRFPDAAITIGARSTTLHRELCGPRFHLLLCGPESLWPPGSTEELEKKYGELLSVRRLVRAGASPALADASGAVHALLAVRASAKYLIRPDGYIGFRGGGADLADTAGYLARILPLID